MTTTSRQIEDDYGQITLSDIWSNKEKDWCFEPCLNFEGIEFWDNSEYVFKFFCGLKKNKKEQIKELKEFCRENKLLYSTVRDILLEIFKTSKKLGWWKKYKLVKNGSKH